MTSPSIITPARTEQEFLEQQAQLARQALRRVGRDIERGLGESTGLQTAADKHPLLTVGGAAAVGALLPLLLPRQTPRLREPRQRRRGPTFFRTAFHSVVAPPMRDAIQALVAPLVGWLAGRTHQHDGGDRPAG